MGSMLSDCVTRLVGARRHLTIQKQFDCTALRRRRGMRPLKKAWAIWFKKAEELRRTTRRLCGFTASQLCRGTQMPSKS